MGRRSQNDPQPVERERWSCSASTEPSRCSTRRRVSGLMSPCPQECREPDHGVASPRQADLRELGGGPAVVSEDRDHFPVPSVRRDRRTGTAGAPVRADHINVSSTPGRLHSHTAILASYGAGAGCVPQPVFLILRITGESDRVAYRALGGGATRGGGVPLRRSAVVGDGRDGGAGCEVGRFA